MPRISVIIPCYNNKPYIRECLNSVLSQTFSDYEVIVVDDGSTDGTGEIIQNYLPRVRYLRQSNQGPAAARNAGIEAASGEYIAFQDADDLWYPEKLEMQLKFMEANPRFAWAYSDMCTFNEKQILQASWFSDRPTHQGKVFEQLINNNFIPTITVMIKKEFLLSMNCFDVNLRIMSRPGIQQFCFTDAWAAPYLLWDGEAVEEPEQLAERIKSFLKPK